MKTERKYMAHLINSTPGEVTPSWERIGADLEELNIEMNAEVETKSNILGETSVKLAGYQPQASIEPYYADPATTLSKLVQGIVDGRKMLDEAKTDVLEVHLWEGDSDSARVAYKESAIIEIVSYGGDTTGYQIPFNLHYLGDRVKGTYDLTTKTFTPDTEV